MNAIVICPADRPQAAFLALNQPLVLVPVLGRSLLDLWLAELAHQGAKKILVLATDRPTSIRRHVGRGERWGIDVDVAPEQRELAPEEALARHAPNLSPAPRVVVLDHLPGGGPLFLNQIAPWFETILAQLEPARADRIGMRQLDHGVFVHTRSRLSPHARLVAPCWIGADSWIGPGAVVGPGTIVESHSFIDDRAEVVASWVGPGTYVGALTELRDSVAWSRHLLKMPTGSTTQVQDAFLLGPVRAVVRRGHAVSLLGRTAALAVLILTSPIVLLAWARTPPGSPVFVRSRAVQTPTSDPSCTPTVVYHNLRAFRGLLRRWPELWKIVLGQFRWVGNRPLTPEEADTLATEYERLWLGVPTGVLSLADAEGCTDAFGDDARAHASFFSARSDWRQRLGILWRASKRLLRPASSPSPSPS